MMYLVLTAMLALNVSKDILNAFIVVNEAMEQTTTNFDSKVRDGYSLFDKAEEAEPLKVQKYNEKAKQVRKISAEMVDYVNQLKYELFSDVDGIPIEEAKTKRLDDMDAKDNFDKPTNFFIGTTDNGKAFELHKKIEDFKMQIKQIVDDSKYELPKGLNTEGPFTGTDGSNESFEKHNFEHVVAAACYTLLNKTIGEIRNMEFEVVNHLYGAIDAKSHKFDNVSAKVIPNSRIVFAGDAYEADIIVAAFDSRQNPIAYWKQGVGDTSAISESMVNSLTKIDGKEGIAHLKIPTSNVGDQKFAGMIQLVGPDGEAQYHKFAGAYSVTRPAAAIAAEKMNVFYAGIPNPVTIAAPVAHEKLRISWGGGTANSLGGGRYDVNVPAALVGREVTVSVSADMDGKTQNMGSATFRVKAVPEPTISLGASIVGGKQPKEAILANPLIVARMSPDFNYELRWSVLSYKVTFVKNGVEDPPITVNGPQFTDQIKNRINTAGSGTIIEINEVKIQSIAGTRNIQKTMSVRIR
jgi:gliding motility-associated protein GldM